MRFEEIEASELAGCDRRFAFRSPTPVPGLAESVARHGVLCPLTIRLAGSGRQVVSGHRRLSAALETGSKKLPCLVFEADELGELSALRLILEDNRFGAGFNAVEAGRIIAMFSDCGLSDREIQEDVASSLGIPSGRESIARHKALASMDRSITDNPLARDPVLLSLARLDPEAGSDLWEGWILPLKPSAQEVRQAVEWIEDLSTRSGAGQAAAVRESLLRSEGRSFLKSLRASRYPRTAAIEAGFADACSALPAGVRARMTNTDAVEFTVTVRSTLELGVAAGKLAESATEAVFKAAAGE